MNCHTHTVILVEKEYLSMTDHCVTYDCIDIPRIRRTKYRLKEKCSAHVRLNLSISDKSMQGTIWKYVKNEQEFCFVCIMAFKWRKKTVVKLSLIIIIYN